MIHASEATHAALRPAPYNGGVSGFKQQRQRVVHRVVVRRHDHRGNLVVEAGPWHVSRSNAENWVEILRYMGYQARVESIHGGQVIGQDDDDLQQALSHMA